MAVFNLTASAGSRVSGASAAGKCAYLEREGSYSRDAEELRHSEHENMPEWARENPQEYWAAADRYERANGRLYREVHFALPNELGKGEQKELAQSFARDLTGGGEAALHAGDPQRGESRRAEQPARSPDVVRARERWHRA